MTTIAQSRGSASNWERLLQVTSTNNRLYVGWFGVLIVTFGSNYLFYYCFCAAPRNIDGIQNQWVPSCRQQHHFKEPCLPNAIGLHMYPIWEPVVLTNGSTTAVVQLVVFHFPIGVFCYWDVNGTLPTRYVALDLCGLQRTRSCSCCRISGLSLRQGSFSDGMPLGISVLSTICLYSKQA